MQRTRDDWHGKRMLTRIAALSLQVSSSHFRLHLRLLAVRMRRHDSHPLLTDLRVEIAQSRAPTTMAVPSRNDVRHARYFRGTHSTECTAGGLRDDGDW